MRIVSVTNNVNCSVILNLSCKKYNVDYEHLKCVDNIKIDDVVVFLEVSPYGIFEDIKCNILNRKYFETIGPDKYKQYLSIKDHIENYIPTYTIDEIDKINYDNVVVKPTVGSLGRGVELLSSKENLFKYEKCIFQKYIPNEKEWRTIVIGNKAVSMIRKQRHPKFFQNNLAMGGTAWAEWNDEVAKLAEDISKIMNIEYVGIDIIQSLDDNKYYFLECNSTSTYETSQLVTKIDISDIFVEYIVNTYYKKKMNWSNNMAPSNNGIVR